ncbi:MAG: S-layer homology domain-containing protein, partial [Oscillospiraceae bacterium]
MKKFLSLVLALVMTMSLVTISAGATEYKDLKDKSEITYEEAVAVMNKIGIISGYEDGTFKPTATLTRGAAAKIITYMMLGTVAAEQLGVAGKPYKDVALDNTFAPYIAYCKSTGLINGYSDGTFRPSAPLDGYSFSKMLL